MAHSNARNALPNNWKVKSPPFYFRKEYARMDVTALTTLISNVGFPIAVTMFLLYQNQKMSQVISENTKAVESLTLSILKNKEAYEHLGGK